MAVERTPSGKLHLNNPYGKSRTKALCGYQLKPMKGALTTNPKLTNCKRCKAIYNKAK